MDEQKLKTLLIETVDHNIEQSEEERQLQKEAMTQIFIEGKSPKEAMKISDKMIDFIYQQAYRNYDSGNYPAAERFFKFLAQLEPFEIRHLIGLAASFQKQKKYEQAIYVYNVWGNLDLKTPFPHFHMGDLYRKLDFPIVAQSCYIYAYALCGNTPEYAEIKEKANLLIHAIAKEKIKKES